VSLDDVMKHAEGPVRAAIVETADGDPATAPAAASSPRGDGVPASFWVPIGPAAIVERLSKRAKLGKLAGFRAVAPDSGAGAARRFTMPAGAGVYDHLLTVRVTPEGEGSRLTFVLAMQRRVPTIAAAILVFSLFPGLWLTDSMLSSYSDWYSANVETWWWYIPMFLLTLPVMWKQLVVSVASAREEAGQIAGALRKELGARDAASTGG
jgi:hypothetical protein